jgi:SAM-dependent methyltransferase
MTSPRLGSAFASGSGRIRRLTPAQEAVRDQIVANDRPTDYEPNDRCLCGRARDDVVLAEVDRHGLAARQVVCRACGLIRLAPRWREERYRRFYEHEYRPLYNPIVESKDEFARQVAASSDTRRRADWIRAACRRRSGSSRPVILEVGAGAGWNLANLPSSWERIGYDVDREYLEIGTRLFGLSMKWGFLDEALLDIRRADAVLLSHLLEHLLCPEEALRTILSMLPKDAIVLIEVPGIFRIHRWRLDVMAYMQNAHVYTFCAATLAATCARAGVEILELDETARAVCRPPSPLSPPLVVERDPRLWRATIRYMRLCALGYSALLGLRAIPIVGRSCGFAWKKLYFPLMSLAAPRSGRGFLEPSH